MQLTAGSFSVGLVTGRWWQTNHATRIAAATAQHRLQNAFNSSILEYARPDICHMMTTIFMISGNACGMP